MCPQTKKILNKLLQTSDHHFEAPNEYVLDLLSIEENMEVSTFLVLECSAFLAFLLTNASIWQNLNKTHRTTHHRYISRIDIIFPTYNNFTIGTKA